MKLKQSNIANLTSLWETASEPFNTSFRGAQFNYCTIENSQWPNKLWFTRALTPDSINLAKTKLTEVPQSLSIPVTNIYNENDFLLMEKHGFKMKFEQIGMSLKLDKSFEVRSSFKTKQVSTKKEADIWSTLFKKAFGYTISVETILKNLKTINYYLGYNNNTPVGTAILHKTENCIGAHAVGILPEMRRQGYAEQIMKSLINIAKEKNNEYMTLQASNMGKGLYLKLGFEEQFLIKNYYI